MEVISATVELVVALEIPEGTYEGRTLARRAIAIADTYVSKMRPDENWVQQDFDVTSYDECKVFYVRKAVIPDVEDGGSTVNTA